MASSCSITRVLRSKLRGLLAIAVGCVVVVTSQAVATSLNMASNGLAAGTTQVLACDSDGVTIVYNVVRDTGPDDRWEVSGLTINGIATACIGGALWLVAVDATGTALASAGPVDVLASTLAVELVPNPDALSVAGVRLVIVGP